MNFGQKCNYLTKTVFFLAKMIFFADLTPKKFYHHEGTAKNNVFVMTLLHGGRQGGRRGPFLAKKVHFWPNICIFGPKSVFGTVLKGVFKGHNVNQLWQP